jgi:hypothetical protein
MPRKIRRFNGPDASTVAIMAGPRPVRRCRVGVASAGRLRPLRPENEDAGSSTTSDSARPSSVSSSRVRPNLVVRWEYRPGSALYVVWSQGRTNEEPYWEDASGPTGAGARLWSAQPHNVFLVKLTCWFSP